jgi:hypothetical protein
MRNARCASSSSPLLACDSHSLQARTALLNSGKMSRWVATGIQVQVSFPPTQREQRLGRNGFESPSWQVKPTSKYQYRRRSSADVLSIRTELEVGGTALAHRPEQSVVLTLSKCLELLLGRPGEDVVVSELASHDLALHGA